MLLIRYGLFERQTEHMRFSYGQRMLYEGRED
jgi:hypothetical protein